MPRPSSNSTGRGYSYGFRIVAIRRGVTYSYLYSYTQSHAMELAKRQFTERLRPPLEVHVQKRKEREGAHAPGKGDHLWETVATVHYSSGS